jgi:HAD superfamily hydrolase (TIGR01509 family)
MLKALLFDFDGLILDTETPDVEAWRAIYAGHGFDYPMEGWSQSIGGWGISTFDPAEALKQLAGNSLNVDALRIRQREESNALILRQPVLDGVMEYLTSAPRLGLLLAIASSSERTWVEPHLTRLGLIGYFDKIICGDDVPPGRTKPHPDIYLKALSELKLRPDEALVLEDSPHGVRAARAAGLFVVAVPNPTTAMLPMGEANLTLKSLADVPLEDLLRRVVAGHDTGHAPGALTPTKRTN